MAENRGASQGVEQQYSSGLNDLNLVPVWRIPSQLEPTSPEIPHVWRWSEVYPQLESAAHVVDVGDGAERRALTLRNPGRKFAGATHTLTTSLQLLLPGEVAPAHRHSMGAFRFVLQGEGAYTVVDGEKIPMSKGDLILTPAWTWHDHGHEGQEPMVWLDGLDVPFVYNMQAQFYEDYPDGDQQPSDRPVSPQNVYRWADQCAALERIPTSEHSPFDGAIAEYVNPATGGHVLPTLACYLQSLPAGEHTRAHRHTSSAVYIVCRGSGHTVVNGQAHAWGVNDILAIPSWAWHEHAADGAEDAVVFCMSDLPMIEPFGLYREEAHSGFDGRQRPSTGSG